MTYPFDLLEQFVIKEDQIVQRIHTCEEIMAIVLDMVYMQGNVTLHIETVKEALEAMQAELLSLRLEKRILAHTNASALSVYSTS